MILHRDGYGNYYIRFYTRLADAARTFFRGHDVTKNAMAWMFHDRTTPRDGELVEQVQFNYEQTRGGRFKIPLPSYWREAENHQGKAYKQSFTRDTLPNYRGDDDEVNIEAGVINAGSCLQPCTYQLG